MASDGTKVSVPGSREPGTSAAPSRSSTLELVVIACGSSTGSVTATLAPDGTRPPGEGDSVSTVGYGTRRICNESPAATTATPLTMAEPGPAPTPSANVASSKPRLVSIHAARVPPTANSQGPESASELDVVPLGSAAAATTMGTARSVTSTTLSRRPAATATRVPSRAMTPTGAVSPRTSPSTGRSL